MAKSSKAQMLPARSKVKAQDTWDLGTLYGSDRAWETDLAKLEGKLAGYGKHKGKLGTSAKALAACLQFDADVERLAERLGTYAFLRTAEDQGDSVAQRMRGRFQSVASKAAQAASFIRPEIMAIPQKTMARLLKDKAVGPWKLALEQVLRYRPHTLAKPEENLLAMQTEMAGASNQIFRQLNDADLKWPAIEDEKGQLIELSHATYPVFLRSPSRAVRANAFQTYYRQYDGHRNALAAAYDASVQRDVYYARARKYGSALEASLFPDNVPVEVYDNLLAAVHASLPAVHRYYQLRRKKMKLKEIHQYDTYVPILSEIEVRHTWDQAVAVVSEAMTPLGDEYTRVLRDGLTTARWADRYPNQGKQSGAFSAGSYDGAPYMLMNFQPRSLDHVFTLAHEAGHSMHSHFSAKHQPFQYYNYTIFVAEVASTFNEQLLLNHMLAKTTDRRHRAYLINHAIDEIRGTIVRQTMFAEFEKITHALVEKGEPLTVETLRREYRKLLDLYFGPEFVIDADLELECLRIPHFYRAFYVYKYATGLSAAIALSQRVLTGGARELTDYLSFLKGGCSKFPLDLLKDAGVDMRTPGPVQAAMGRFADLVAELESLL